MLVQVQKSVVGEVFVNAIYNGLLHEQTGNYAPPILAKVVRLASGTLFVD